MYKNRMLTVVPLLCALALCSCRADARIDYSELNRRLRAVEPDLCFSEDALFFADGTYYAYYGCFPEELLFTMREDGSYLLDRVTLTVSGGASSGTVEGFRRLALALTEALLPGGAERVASESGLAEDPLFRDRLGESSAGKWSASLVSSTEGASYILQYSAG